MDLGEDFRGWKLGGAYYFANERIDIYVVSKEDEVAIPVYQNNNVPAHLSFVNYSGTTIDVRPLQPEYEISDSDKFYGHVVHLPEPMDNAGFVGWYSKGYVFNAGYLYVITDVDTEFTAMFESDVAHPEVQTDCDRLPITPGELNILHGNVYTLENTPSGFIYVPHGTDWDDSLPMGSDGSYEIRDLTVKIDFGDSLDKVVAHAGEAVELPPPIYDDETF